LEQQFVGTLGWKIFDFLTFGVFEKKGPKTRREN
jgi:hypothetical protein